MEVVRAKSDEAEALTAIAYESKRYWKYPENWMGSWRGVLTITSEFIAANVAYCAKENGRVVGFYAVTNENDGLRLEHLWILPEAMGRGIGRELFGHAIAQARRLGHRTLRIEGDPHAEGFYTRLGARRVGVTLTTIENRPRELPL